MSVELAVTIALAALTGLCVLLWNTDGSLDWISYGVGVIVHIVLLTVIVWNTACSMLSGVGADAAGAQASAVRTAIRSEAWSLEVTGGLLACALACDTLPHIITAARKARR